MAELARRGVGRGALQGAGYKRIARGYYRRALDEMDRRITPTQRIVDARIALPDRALIAGWAAAFVHGVDALDGLDDHTLRPLPVPVLLPPGLHRVSTEAIHYRQSKRLIEASWSTTSRSRCVYPPPSTLPVPLAI
jgi:hypothetical protein